ncbi:N-acetylglucosamine kinase [Paraferrimonas sedimenticola]|uniref:ATPase n=1 Tax=Paraferrimonas sedimenticola TaxID=375674 RepID=A0AA37RUH0_9GAMM|nr:BadF/BadG/BcrA/BcrD ATPase family protein [Paraferrimonas sedimenticola]GLP95072.1 ATPase [Paraferrimonas sedimenticola]
MDSSQCKNTPLYVGIDGGGTKCCASLYDVNGTLLASAITGPANPLHGLERTLESIVSATSQALANSGLSQYQLSDLVVGAGLAGVNLPSLYAEVEAWEHPFAHFYLTTDLHIACLGAHQQKDGAIVICGTGSCGYALVGQQSHRLGGHGFPYGDKGSGAWIGMEAFKRVLLHFDGVGSAPKLAEALLLHFDVSNDLALVECLAKQPSSEYAKLANLVFDCAEAKDPVAIEIITEGAVYLNQLIEQLSAHSEPQLPVSILGGLARRYQAWLSASAKQRLVPARGEPQLGALLYAQSQHQMFQGMAS